MDIQSLIFLLMDLAGTIAFAASGAIVAIRQKMDLFGVCVLGVCTAVGGGMMRDVILGQIPAALKDPAESLQWASASPSFPDCGHTVKVPWYRGASDRRRSPGRCRIPRSFLRT